MSSWVRHFTSTMPKIGRMANVKLPGGVGRGARISQASHPGIIKPIPCHLMPKKPRIAPAWWVIELGIYHPVAKPKICLRVNCDSLAYQPGNYKLIKLTLFFFFFYNTVGARVWAFYSRNGLFYRGFVSKVANSIAHVLFDDGDKATYRVASLDRYVVLDELPQAGRSYKNSQVIAYWPGDGKNKFFKGTVTAEKPGSYYVSSEWRKRWEEIYQLRPMGE